MLGLPRAGVPVAFQVAQALGAPLDVIVVRRLGVPFQPELAMGAVGEGGVLVINRQVVQEAKVPEDELAAVQAQEQAAVATRAAHYRARWPRQPLNGRVAVVVDDGIATGATARAACQIARAHGASRVVLAVPVAPPDGRRQSAPMPTNWSASARREGSWPSASSTPGSPRCPMSRSWPASTGLHGAVAARQPQEGDDSAVMFA